jgi:hypothetical protein
MTKVHEQKCNFCRHELLQLVQAIDKDVLRLEYEVHDNEEETVTVVWLTAEAEYKKTVYVTGDSFSALTTDVLKAIS